MQESTTLVSVFWTCFKETKRTFLITGGVRNIPYLFYHLLGQKSRVFILQERGSRGGGTKFMP